MAIAQSGAFGPAPVPAPAPVCGAVLHLLCAPAGVGLPHVGGRLDRRDELEDNVANTDEADNGARDDAQHAAVQQDRAYEDVKGTTADEGEQEGGVSGDLRRDLELEEASGY